MLYVAHRRPAQRHPSPSALTAQQVAGTSEGADWCPGASSEPGVSSCEAETARVGEVLEHPSRSVSAADSPRCASAPCPDNSPPGMGNGGEEEGKEGRVGRISPFRYLGHLVHTGRLLWHTGARRQVSGTVPAGSSVR